MKFKVLMILFVLGLMSPGVHAVTDEGKEARPEQLSGQEKLELMEKIHHYHETFNNTYGFGELPYEDPSQK